MYRYVFCVPLSKLSNSLAPICISYSFASLPVVALWVQIGMVIEMFITGSVLINIHFFLLKTD